jgi:endoglucanase
MARARRTARPAGPPVEPPVELLAALSNADAVSSDEGATRRLVLEAIRPHADEVRVDALGNVLAVKRARGRGRASAPRVMVAAHLDEVGLMVVDHDSDGGLKVEAVGGVNERALPGQVMRVGRQALPGIIGLAPIHLLPADRHGTPLRLSQMRVDIGAGSPEAARRQAPVGTLITFATEFMAAEGFLRGKALDDRLGCAGLVELLRRGPYPVELHAAFTVQEEVGLRGARVAAFAAEPHIAIAMDCTPANDLPSALDDRPNLAYNCRLDHGPVIYVADARTLHDHRLVDFLIGTAERAGLPYQLRQPGGGSTDAGALQLTGAGVPVVSVSVPGRYLHGPAALARAADWANTLELMRQALHAFRLDGLER